MRLDKLRSRRWIHGWIMLALLVMLGTLLLSPLAQAQPKQVRDIDQLRAIAQQAGIARSGPAIAAVGPRAAAAPRTAPQSPAEMEGPRQQPARANQGAPTLSLADRQKAKAGPRLTLSAQSGTPGSRITLRGRGYAPGQRINLFWDGTNVTERRLIVANLDGTFDWPLDIPKPTTSGQHSVGALEATPAGAALAASSNSVATSSATFTVVGGLPPGSSIASPSTPVVQLPSVKVNVTPQAVKPWTFAVYIAGDNSLSDYGDINIGQMAATGGTNANANIVVLKDVKNQPTTYLEVRNNSTANVTPSSVTGNLDTGQPQPFIDFMTFIAANYPAQHYAVVIWNHGGGWTGIESDDPSGSIWDMTELRTALAGGLQAIGRPQYDAVMFDACMMGQYEVALQIADQTDVMAGSEEVIPGDGYPYDRFVSLLVNPPAGGVTADALGAKLIEAYASYYGPTGPRSTPKYTLSEFKLEGSVPDLKAKVEAFAMALLAVGSTSAGNIQAARDASDTYEYTTFIDLAGFASNIKTKLNDATVSAAADALLAALAKSPANTIQTESHGAEHSTSNGLSIYLPAPSQTAKFNEYSAIAAMSGSKWQEFAKAFYTGQWPNTPAPPAPGEEPPPAPPPAASSSSDIVYSSQVTSQQADLERVQSTAAENTSAETFSLLSDGFNNTYPRWSYDGKLVVYNSDRAADPNAKTGLEMDLFLIKADGTPITGATGPVQLTSSQSDCPDGPGTGTTCTIEQSYDPSWLPSGAGLLYTRFSYDLTSPDPTDWVPLQSIHLIDLTKQAGQDGFDGQILPNAGLELGSDIQFANADFNGKFLMFTYRTDNVDIYGADFVNNNIGFIDLEVNPAITRYFTLNTQDDIDSGNYLITDYPVWRPNQDELAFLFTRVGDPAVLSALDPRQPPTAGTPENPYATYDIGDLNFAKDADGTYAYTMNAPLWTFAHPEEGEGVNLRPSWKPDDSGNLTASYSVDGGFTYNIGLFLNTGDTATPAERGFTITNDGYSTFPSWGTVTAADILARLEVKPPYLEPGANSTYYLSGAGFSAGETVQVLRGTTPEAVATLIGSVQAGADGTFEAPFTLTKRTPAGPIYFKLQGSKVSNVDRLVVLTPRSITASNQITPGVGGSVATTDGSITFTFPPASVAQTTTLTLAELAGPSQPLPGGGNVLRSFKLTATDANSQPVAQFGQPVTLVIKYTDAELADFPPINETQLVLRILINGVWTDVPATIDTATNTITAAVNQPGEFAISEVARARIFLPLVRR